MAEQSLNALIGQIGKSIKESVEAVDRFGLDAFMSNFTVVPASGSEPEHVVPKTVRIPIPKPDGTFLQKDVPIVCLLHHSAIHIEEMRIKMKISLHSGQGPGGESTLDAEIGPGVNPQSDDRAKMEAAEFEVLFKRGVPPEGFARIQTELNKTIN